MSRSQPEHQWPAGHLIDLLEVTPYELSQIADNLGVNAVAAMRAYDDTYTQLDLILVPAVLWLVRRRLGQVNPKFEADKPVSVQLRTYRRLMASYGRKVS